jgi:O-antigen ligase
VATVATVDATDERTTALLLAALVVAAMLPIGTVLSARAGRAADPNLRTSLFAFDAVLACVALVVAARGRGRTWSRPAPLVLVALALLLVEALSFAVHPSSRGVELLLRFAGVGAVVAAIAGLRHAVNRQLLLGTILAIGAVEGALGVVQSALGHPIGLDHVEYGGRLYRFGSSYAGRGTLDHPYHLATLLVVAIAAGLIGATRSANPRRWALGIVYCSAGLAVTYSRAALFSLVPLVVLLAVAAKRRSFPGGRRVAILLVAALAIGFTAGAVSLGDGWASKSTSTVRADSVDAVTTGRVDRWKEAGRLIRREPLTGVGVGNYVAALRHVEHSDLLPSHDAILDVTAEAGILAGGLALTLLAGLAWRSWRSGFLGRAVFVTLAPYLVLDSYPNSFPVGLVVLSLWVGLLVMAWRAPDAQEVEA